MPVEPGLCRYVAGPERVALLVCVQVEWGTIAGYMKPYLLPSEDFGNSGEVFGTYPRKRCRTTLLATRLRLFFNFLALDANWNLFRESLARNLAPRCDPLYAIFS